MELYCSLVLNLTVPCREYVGGFEASSLGLVEPPMEYHIRYGWNSNLRRYPVQRQYQVGSLTGAVAS